MQPKRSFDAFRVLDRAEREAHLHRYLAYLRERDGRIDLPRRHLAAREPEMRALENTQVRWRGGIDRAGFERSLAGSRNEVLDPQTEWVLAAARANEGERYGVEIEIGRFVRRGNRFPGVPCQETMLYVMLQEAYHCRILVDLCRACGLEFDPKPPGWASRGLIVAIGTLPSWMRWVPVMAGELVGCAVFRILNENTRLFAAQAEVELHLQKLMRTIWIDEVLHVAYLRALLGRIGLLFVRAMLPVVAWSVLREVPQLRNLGCRPRRIVESALAGIDIPDEIDWMQGDGQHDPVAKGAPIPAQA
jgi:hypothetical protein